MRGGEYNLETKNYAKCSKIDRNLGQNVTKTLVLNFAGTTVYVAKTP